MLVEVIKAKGVLVREAAEESSRRLVFPSVLRGRDDGSIGDSSISSGVRGRLE